MSSSKPNPMNVFAGTNPVHITSHNWPKGADATWFGFCFGVGLTGGISFCAILGSLGLSLVRAIL